jgi:hypothetical protein
MSPPLRVAKRLSPVEPNGCDRNRIDDVGEQQSAWEGTLDDATKPYDTQQMIMIRATWA